MVRIVRIGRTAGFLALALSLSGCAWLVVARANPGDATTPLQIVAPAHRSQVAGMDAIPIEIRFGADVVVPSLRVELATGPDGAFGTELQDRLTVDGDRATGTLTPAELQEGITRIRARAAVRGGPPAEVDAVFSYEPRIQPPRRECETLGQSHCLLPFPSDRFTTAARDTDTGVRVDLAAAALPANTAGVHVDPTEWNRNDGFSPGSVLVAHVPGVDLARSRMPTIGTMSSYQAVDAGVVVIDIATGERWPVWAELDAWATSDATRALLVRPTRNFLEGHRYAVGLVNLRDADGNLIPPNREFEVLRDEIPTFIPPIEARRNRMRATLSALHQAGVHVPDLYLAWEFTVASERNLSERVLTMRDDAYAQLGGAAPSFTVTTVEDDVSPSIWRRVRGTVDVPMYLTGTGQPGSRLHYGSDGLPARNGTFAAPFVCNIPRSVHDGTSPEVAPGRALVYGHGLLGSRNEVNGFGPLHDAGRIVACATDWIGMSSGDIGNVAAILQDLSHFPSLPDRLQQALVNFQFLAKIMKDADGFVTHPAFRAGPADEPVIETGAVFFNGNSQGGIAGGAATAISKEWTRAVLGVPAMNYSTLLTRSIHWDTFSPVLFASYPDELERTIGYTLIQMLWDRGEANGYAHHITDDPYPGTPSHQVLLIEAFGDHQVANVATETEARTIGARLWTPALAPGRTNLQEPFFGLEPVPDLPYGGSVLVVWDFGTPAPPLENLPPRPPEFGSDPHGKGAGEPRVAGQVDDFLRIEGFFADHCGGGPCVSGV